MEKVKCDHCGLEFNKDECIPCTWEEYDLTWHYCKRCNECFTGGGYVKFKNGSMIKTLTNNEKVISIKGARSKHIIILK